MIADYGTNNVVVDRDRTFLYDRIQSSFYKYIIMIMKVIHCD